MALYKWLVAYPDDECNIRAQFGNIPVDIECRRRHLVLMVVPNSFHYYLDYCSVYWIHRSYHDHSHVVVVDAMEEVYVAEGDGDDGPDGLDALDDVLRRSSGKGDCGIGGLAVGG